MSFFLNYPIHQTRVNRKLKLFGIEREDLANLSWTQPTSSALLLITQIYVPDKCGTISTETHGKSGQTRDEYKIKLRETGQIFEKTTMESTIDALNHKKHHLGSLTHLTKQTMASGTTGKKQT